MPQTPTAPDRDEFEPIAPMEVRLAAAGEGPARTGSGPNRAGTPWRPLLALAGLVVLAVAGFLLLPEPAPTPSAPVDDAPAPDAAAAPARPAQDAAEDGAGAGQTIVPPYEQMRLERERAAAQDVLENLMGLTDQVDARAVQRWGADSRARAKRIAEDGDRLFLARNYAAAQLRYRQAEQSMQALLARADEVVSSQLEVGEQALADGDSARASASFAFAAAVDPDNARARAGARRATVLDEVLRLVRDARDVAADGALTAASGMVDKALALDPDSPPAKALRADLDARLLDARFTRAMSDGYAALRTRDFDKARADFRQAGKLRPKAPEVADALNMVDAQALAARIEALRKEAVALETAEQWSDAADRYQAALKLDPTLAFARDGLSRAQARAKLSDDLDAILAHTEHLNDDAAHAAASAVLERARAVASPGPELVGRIARLARALQIAATPVPVQFVSDGQTRVTLLKVDRLGTFEQRTLSLRPGAYVATGARDGYRDVRLEFEVGADGTPAPIDIRCRTRI